MLNHCNGAFHVLTSHQFERTISSWNSTLDENLRSIWVKGSIWLQRSRVTSPYPSRISGWKNLHFGMCYIALISWKYKQLPYLNFQRKWQQSLGTLKNWKETLVSACNFALKVSVFYYCVRSCTDLVFCALQTIRSRPRAPRTEEHNPLFLLLKGTSKVRVFYSGLWSRN